jgi:DNA-binding transcriptional ArsR family regulator
MSAVAVVGERERVEAIVRGPRLRLLEALAERPDSAAGLAVRLGLPRQTLNYHLRQLEAAWPRRARRAARRRQLRRAASRSDRRRGGGRGAPCGRSCLRRKSALPRCRARSRRGAPALAEAAGRDDDHRNGDPLRERGGSNGVRRRPEGDRAGARARYHHEDAAGGRRFTVLAVAHPTVPARRTP